MLTTCSTHVLHVGVDRQVRLLSHPLGVRHRVLVALVGRLERRLALLDQLAHVESINETMLQVAKVLHLNMKQLFAIIRIKYKYYVQVEKKFALGRIYISDIELQHNTKRSMVFLKTYSSMIPKCKRLNL